MAIDVTPYVTGKDVCVNGVNTLGHIMLQRTSHANAIYDSSGRGGADRMAGNIDFQGYYWAWGHTPPVLPNDLFDLEFTLTGTDTTGSSGAYVRCTGMDIFVPTFDPKGENAVYYALYFAAAGNDLVNTGATVTAPTVLTKYPVAGLACTLTPFTTVPPEDGIEAMQFSMHQQGGAPDINSSTNGVFFRSKRNLDWEFTYRKAVNALSKVPALNSVQAIKMFVTSTLYWAANYGIVTKHEGKFDHGNTKILAVEVTLSKCKSGTDVGSVMTPGITPGGGATVWPV
jgi:hypothetical protein